MLNVHYVARIQTVFTHAYISDMVMRLKAMGHNDANPFNSEILVGAPTINNAALKCFVTVQTKPPAQRKGEYHIWIRPLSMQVSIITPDGPMLVDTVYGLLNGSEGIEENSFIDDSRVWI